MNNNIEDLKKLLEKNNDGAAEKEDDPVNHPNHYNSGQFEVIDVIVDQGFGEGFCLGNVLKYVMRSGFKGKYLEDLKKSKFYLDYWIKHTEEEEEE